jgi:competence protein ComEA
MKRFILNFLHFSRRERLGAIALTLLCAAIFILPEIIRRLYPQKTTDFSQFQTDIQAFRDAMQATGTTTGTSGGDLFAFDPNTASLEDFVRLGLSEKVAGTICNYRDKGGRFRKPEDFQKIWSLPKEDFERLLPYIQIESTENEEFETKQVSKQFELFVFDPNTATESDFLRLGLPQRTAKSILNYRAKGGFFRKKEDFRKIYTLSEEDYARLEPYIMFEQTTAVVEVSRPATFSGGSNTNAAPKFSIKGPLDINRADIEDWQRLPGIGEKRAAQLVHFRESLGGFLSVDQVGEIYGLPDSVFQKIRPMLALNLVEVRKTNLNTASVEDLDKHPYISGKQAKLIVAYRAQHGAFASVDDLTKIAAFTDKKWLEKVRPYLSVK